MILEFEIQKNAEAYVEIYIMGFDGHGKTGLTLGTFTEVVRKPPDDTIKALTGETYTEQENGWYGLHIPANFCDVNGEWKIHINEHVDGGCFDGAAVIKVMEHNPYDFSDMAKDSTVAKAAGTKGTDNIFDGVESLQQGSGSETATIYAKETTTENPIPEAYFEIWDESNSTRLYRDEDSDANGTAIFNLAPGNYKVKIRKPFWDFPTYTDLTVPVGGTSLTVHATLFSPSAPPGPDLCVVYGWVIDTQNNKIFDAIIKATLDNDDAFDEGSQKVADMTIETTSNLEGYFELVLIPNSKYSITGTKYEFEIVKVEEGYGWRKLGVVPDLDNVKLEDVVNPAAE